MVEYSRKNKHEDDIKEIHSGNGNVESIRFLVHPRSKNADSDQESRLDNHERNRLDCAVRLGERQKHSLDEDVEEERQDEVVRRGAELDVEESPLVQCRRIGVEDVRRIFVHADRPFGNAPDLQCGP